MLNGATPSVVMGSVSGSLEALSALVELEPRVTVPGHGPLGGMEMLNSCGSYLRWIRMAAARAAEAGLSPLEAARQLDLGEFAELSDPERLVGNLHRALAECKGVGRGEPIDLQEALADTITLNGGRPLRCRA